MRDAINEFIEGKCCSNNLEKYILGQDISSYRNKDLRNIFNYNRYYFASIPNFAELSSFQETQMRKIFFNEMNIILGIFFFVIKFQKVK